MEILQSRVRTKERENRLMAIFMLAMAAIALLVLIVIYQWVNTHIVEPLEELTNNSTVVQTEQQ